MDSDSIKLRSQSLEKGLFTTKDKDIEPETLLCKVSGSEKELNFYETTLLAEKESDAIQIDFEKYLLCEPPFLYSNHSCNPNCGVNDNLELFALTNQSRRSIVFGLFNINARTASDNEMRLW